MAHLTLVLAYRISSERDKTRAGTNVFSSPSTSTSSLENPGGVSTRGGIDGWMVLIEKAEMMDLPSVKDVILQTLPELVQ